MVELDPVILNLARDYFDFTEDKGLKVVYCILVVFFFFLMQNNSCCFIIHKKIHDVCPYTQHYHFVPKKMSYVLQLDSKEACLR
jgi:hypothetical protein